MFITGSMWLIIFILLVVDNNFIGHCRLGQSLHAIHSINIWPTIKTYNGPNTIINITGIRTNVSKVKYPKAAPIHAVSLGQT